MLATRSDEKKVFAEGGFGAGSTENLYDLFHKLIADGEKPDVETVPGAVVVVTTPVIATDDLAESKSGSRKNIFP